MAISHRYITDSYELYIWTIEETIEELEELAPRYTSDPRYLKITSTRRKSEWLASKIIYGMIAPKEKISYNSMGAPVASKGMISISHSGNMVALIYSDTKAYGIDIEDSGRNFAKVARRFLSDGEHTLLKSIDGRDINTLYGICWCVKEAIYKTLGDTNIEFSQDIIVTDIDLGKSRCIAQERDNRHSVDIEMIGQLIVAISTLQ